MEGMTPERAYRHHLRDMFTEGPFKLIPSPEKGIDPRKRRQSLVNLENKIKYSRDPQIIKAEQDAAIAAAYAKGQADALSAIPKQEEIKQKDADWRERQAHAEAQQRAQEEHIFDQQNYFLNQLEGLGIQADQGALGMDLPEGYLISGAGTKRVNGLYMPQELPGYTDGGRGTIAYRLEGTDVWLLRWNLEYWYICDVHRSDQFWERPGHGAREYYMTKTDAVLEDPPAGSGHFKPDSCHFNPDSCHVNPDSCQFRGPVELPP